MTEQSPQNPHIRQTNSLYDIRDIDPNVQQNHAANPQANVWVGASAGTGKTKVLTDRVLRLLLPKNGGEPGAAPLKILCLTFTKAGANEMALRINKTLGEWTMLPENELMAKLRKLLGQDPSPEHMQSARRLFAQIVDTPGGIQIMTIHSFCQSILARFPLEAGLSPNFTLLDENQAADLLTKAQKSVLNNPPEPVAEAIHTLTRMVNEEQFFQLLKDTIKERAQLQSLIQKHFNADGLYTELCRTLDIPAGQNPEDYITDACRDEVLNLPALRRICAALSVSTNAGDQERLDKIQSFAETPEDKRAQHFERYRSFFLTDKDQPRKTVLRKPTLEDNPDFEDLITQETIRLQEILETQKRLYLANYTHHLLQVCIEIINQYNKIKQEHAAIDFDDLILYTYRLLENKKDAQWVLFKLDQRIDHILVDEAQDTNPDQWKIIDALCDEFYSAAPEDQDTTRTVFVVGDEKQSIYSFQRASPEEFERMRSHLRQKIEQSRAQWDDIALNISFRTTKSVLQLVDKVFTPAEMHKGLGIHPIAHHSYRQGQAGLVELWPLFQAEEDETPPDPWDPPVKIIENRKSGPILADFIASQIATWIEEKEPLPARDRAVQPGDIMLLFRTRNPLVSYIIRALKNKNIPVSGADRMLLNEQIPIQDLLACAAFGLLPEDDLTLAALLKSPFIGWSEEQLFDLAYNRTGTLWQELYQNHPDDPATVFLKQCMYDAKSLKPLDFFNALLHRKCPANGQSGLQSIRARLGDDAIDPINEFLNLALDFEYDNIPTLQHFLHWMDSNQTVIKREMESGHNAVRIMTVHASKGLQAPIVILPDTIRSTRHVPGQSDKRLLWPSQTGLSTPLWSPHSGIDPAPYKAAYEQIEERLDEEYRRLLYVAMTRAEDRLYITGHRGKTEPLPDSWYRYVEQAMRDWDEVEETPEGHLRLYNPQTKDPDRATDRTDKETQEQAPLPPWLSEPAPQEADTTGTLNPSRPREEEPPVISPLSQADNSRFNRGNLIHTLLQFLPDLPPETRREAAQRYLNKNAPAQSEEARKEIESEVLRILEHPDFGPYFAENSQAEVPLTAKLPNGDVLSGQIDRLVIGEDTIWVLDFKSNRPPPQKQEDVAAIYIDQMRAYRDAVQAIYPDKRIKTALLWTYTPHFMEITL